MAARRRRKAARSQSELARACGVSRTTIARWIAAGMPDRRPDGWDVAEVQAWRKDHEGERAQRRAAAATPESIDRALLRTDTAGTRAAELQERADRDFDRLIADGANLKRLSVEAVARFRHYKALEQQIRAEQLAGDVIPRSRVDDMLVERAAAFRRVVLQIPARVDAELAAETEPMECRRILAAEIEAMLADIIDRGGLPS
jgi:transcriptional regulator with XRE-family HTH domain